MESDVEKRPWGYFEVLFSGLEHKVKRLVINPKYRTSLQVHKGREELLLVISGEVNVEIDGIEQTVCKDQECKIVAGSIHRLTNKSDCVPVEIIEIQHGEYMREDDIIRLEDDFGRVL